MKITQMTLEQIYLDWVNNFLTVSAFAEHYNIDVEDAVDLVNVTIKICKSK